MKFFSSDSIIIVTIRLSFHAFYKEIREHSMFGLLSGLAVWSPVAAVKTVNLSGIACSFATIVIGQEAISISVPMIVPE